MKTRNFQKALAVVAAGGLALLVLNAPAQDSTNTTAAPQLSYGVSEIVKLAQAKVSDDTIIAYIKSSRSSYGLNAAQILYLRQQGVSDTVITTMLNQPKPGVATATAPMPAAPAPQPAASTTITSTADNSAPSVQPTVTYIQTVPTTYYYYDPPYYYPPYGYYGWPYPAVSLSFGWGGHWGGGWHGGGWHGGGWHH